MNLFKQAINDIFKDDNFTDTCMINGVEYTCIQSAIIPDEISFTDYGREDQTAFTLSIKLPVKKAIKKNDKVVYLDENFKVDFTQSDSANSCLKIYLVSLSKGV